MSASITAQTDHSITLEVTIELLPSMLESERGIQVALNEAGCLDHPHTHLKDQVPGDLGVTEHPGQSSKGISSQTGTLKLSPTD